MAVIIKEIRLRGSKGELKREAIFDSGSTYSCIHPELARALGTIEPLPEPMEFSTAKEDEKVTAKTLQAWRLKLDFERDEIIIDPKVTKLWLL